MASESDHEILSTSNPPSGNSPKPRLLVVLLLLICTTQLYSAITLFQKNRIEAARAATYKERVKAAQELLATQRQVIGNLMTDYQNRAYSNPQIDTIMKQQLVATEYAIVGLQVIAIQNSQVIELLAATP